MYFVFKSGSGKLGALRGMRHNSLPQIAVLPIWVAVQFVLGLIVLVPFANAEVICNPNAATTNLRSGPGTADSHVVGNLPNNSVITTLGTQQVEGAVWVRVSYLDPQTSVSTEGYVKGQNVSPLNKCANRSSDASKGNGVGDKIAEVRWDAIPLARCKIMDADIAKYYDGPCMNGLAEGFGHAKGIDRYSGNFRAGKKQGEGRYIWNNHSFFTGRMENDRLVRGRLVWEDGTVYEGELGVTPDNLNVPNGHGKKVYAWGDVYEGEFVYGFPSGKGKKTYADGSVYVGDFKHGKRHGIGLQVFNTKACVEILKTHNRCNASANGRWEDGLYQEGILTFSDGQRHIGRVFYEDGAMKIDVIEATMNSVRGWLGPTGLGASSTSSSSSDLDGGGGQWGALAVDRNHGRIFGFSHNYDSRSSAEDRALRECNSQGGGECSVRLTYSTGCAAFAADQGDGDAYGWGQEKSGSSARSVALSNCRSQGGNNCEVRSWSCN